MKKLILLVLSLSLGGLLYAQMKTSETTDYKLVFYDDFDQDTGKPDPKYWSFAVPDGAPWSIYLSKSYDQAYLQDGKLVLKAEKAKRYRTGGVQNSNLYRVDGLLFGYCLSVRNIQQVMGEK